jgi:hypothetical protein
MAKKNKAATGSHRQLMKRERESEKTGETLKREKCGGREGENGLDLKGEREKKRYDRGNNRTEETTGQQGKRKGRGRKRGRQRLL